MDGRGYNNRYLILLIIVGVLVLSCVFRLFDLQIVNGKEYRQIAEQRLIRAYPVKAPRGEILDRYGEPFVENRMGYVVRIQDINLSDDELNDVIIRICNLVDDCGGKIVSDFPILYDQTTNSWEFTYTSEKTEIKTVSETDDPKAYEDYLLKQQEKIESWKKENKLEKYESAQRIMEYYRTRFAVAGKYTDAEALKIVAVRYDMSRSGFGAQTPYVVAKDINSEAVQRIKEQSMFFPGVEIEIEPTRVFTSGKTAAHILGRTGKIYAEEYQELKDKGYGMNDIIGKDGLEKYLENYLKGRDGYRSVSMSKNGGVNEILQSQQVEPGNYVKLTLDLDLQKAMEKALQKHITDAVDINGAGGAIAIIPDTGEVLALASYPSYDPSSFDKDYDKLLNSKSKPLFNRVLNGTYSPGSTLKPLTAIAGLETGEIYPDTYIVDKGKYTFYSDYQPTCLIYSQKKETHGTIEVSEAIGVSCNYFFFEVGRRVGIETLNDYAKKFGLGEKTGIELDESVGLMANPDYRKKNNAQWYPGDVIQASIGQSDSMFTPAQLANYIATLLNKGKRYKLHLVDEILEYNTNNVIEETKIELVDNNPISDTTYEKVKNGMRQVVTKGTAMTAFEDCEYQAAGKTGTAEVPGGADNVLFVGFAPYDKPEIVVAVVIEHGYSSTYAARVARDIFDAYMELKAKRANPEEVKKIMEEKKEEKAERIEEERENSKAANSGNNKQFSDKDNSEGIAPVETTAPIAEKTAGNGTL